MTTVQPVVAVGSDRVWRAHLERMLALRSDWCWRGGFDSHVARSGALPHDAVWLIDGDDRTLARLIYRRASGPVRLYFFGAPTAALLRDCLQGGAHGCLDKRAPPHLVLHALRAARTGLFAAAPRLLLEALSQPSTRATTENASTLPSGHELTRRQREIVHWALQGLSNKEIARCLGISPETVKTHLHRAFAREGMHGRMGLATRHRDELRL